MFNVTVNCNIVSNKKKITNNPLTNLQKNYIIVKLAKCQKIIKKRKRNQEKKRLQNAANNNVNAQNKNNESQSNADKKQNTTTDKKEN